MNFNKIVRNLNYIILRKPVFSPKMHNFQSKLPKYLHTNRNGSSNSENKEFMNLLPSVIQELTDTQGNNEDIKKHFKRALLYNLPGRNLDKEPIVTFTYRNLENTDKLTTSNIQLANILGWCTELLLTVYFVTDDILDAESRSNKHCWYNAKGVGVRQAFSDSKMMEGALYFFLKKHFSNHRSYNHLLNLFCEVDAKLALGQGFDIYLALNCCSHNYIKFFNIKTYEEMVKYKSSYALTILPVISGMYLTSNHNFQIPKHVEDILFILGYLMQLENDSINYFVDDATSNNRGNDIPEGKLSWLIVKALELATPQQLEVLINNYGKPELQSQKLVEDVYEEMQLFSVYQRHRNDTINIMKQHIYELPDKQIKNFFNAYLDKYTDPSSKIYFSL